jgi:PiT family inorganic phosphate transporter
VNTLTPLIPLLVLVIIQDILTGVFGAPSIVATMVASQAMSPRRAIWLSTLAQLVGPFLFGVAVASTLGSEVVEVREITPLMLCAALSATVYWMVMSWRFRIPSSSTHALIGGLVGAVVVALGPSAIHGNGLGKILLTLTMTAPIGFLGGFLVTRVCRHLTREATPRADHRFNRGQHVASVFLGLAIGSNNAQNAMGITALGLVASGVMPHFEVPLWVVIVSAVCLAVGNLVGGMRLIRSVGTEFFPIRPMHGFGAELSSVAVIAVSSMVGGNVSTTHVTSMSIIGAGSAERLSMIQWGFVQKVLLTWVLTIPLTAALAGLFYVALRALGVS